MTNNALDCPSYWHKEPRHTVLEERYGRARGWLYSSEGSSGSSYHPAHVSRVVRALGLTLQKPQRRAEQRDEEAIEHWKEKKWPSLKKGR